MYGGITASQHSEAEERLLEHFCLLHLKVEVEEQNACCVKT